jgi:hypothetical protein
MEEDESQHTSTFLQEDDEITDDYSISNYKSNQRLVTSEYQKQVASEKQKTSICPKIIKIVKMTLSLRPILYYLVSTVNFITVISVGSSSVITIFGVFFFLIASLVIRIMMIFDVNFTKLFLRLRIGK